MGSSAPVQGGAGTAPAGATPSDPFAVPSGPRDAATDAPAVDTGTKPDLEPWKKARRAKGLAPPAATCAAFVGRAPSKDGGGLVEALAETDAGARDARLVALARNAKTPAAWTTALRADLAPIECADAVADPFLDALTPAASDSPASVRLLVGLSLAGKLSRTASAPPSMGPLRDKEKVKAFVVGPLKSWLVEQSTAIELLSSGAAGLTGYARGLAAIEAGIAEMRLVDKMRSAPVPESWDPELKTIYEAALDEALEPRKKRGRDAALVGMSDFAKLGVLRDARIDRARALLSKLYGGRRIDALDGLLLPSAPASSTSTPQDAAIAQTSLVWLDDPQVGLSSDPRTLARGVTASMRDAQRAAGSGADDRRSAYARARLDLGRVYWRRVDFVEAAVAAKPSTRPEDRLVLALALALAHGPNGAVDMMRAASPSLLDLRHTEALDAIVAEGGPLAGLAAYDAAHVRALSPPDGDDAVPHLRDVAARFRRAEGLLTDPAQKKRAAERAVEVDAIVAATAGNGAAPQ